MLPTVSERNEAKIMNEIIIYNDFYIYCVDISFVSNEN